MWSALEDSMAGKKDGYDRSKDILLAEVGGVPITAGVEIKVEVWQYGDGIPKISMSKAGESFTSSKVGRIAPSTARSLASLLRKAAEVADDLRKQEKDLENAGQTETL